MLRFVLKRLLWLIPVLLAITILTFTLTNLSVGSPAANLLRDQGVAVTKEAVQAKEAELGLDQPPAVQYIQWVKGVCRLDLGVSFKTKKPVTYELARKFPATLRLTLCSLLILTVVSLILGALAALYPHSLIDRFSRGLAFATVSIPPFLLGLGLLYLFGVHLKWIKIIGDGSLKYVWLPAITQGVSHTGPFIILLRNSMLEVLGKGYVKAARAKGLSEAVVISRHVLRNAILPMLTKLGVTFASMLGGSSVMEALFSWPGIGRLAMDSIYGKDIPVIQGFILLSAACIVVINLLVDIAYQMIDAKLKVS
jgi:peptide/nickel transport system permease protein